MCTEKRRTEFLGGRIAGKLAVNVCRVSNHLSWLRWHDVDIVARDGGMPEAHCGDGVVWQVSVAHCRSTAMACATTRNHEVGIDIEDGQTSVRPYPEMFNLAELHQIGTVEAARQRWVLKEACGKLSGKGILSHVQDVYTYRFLGQLWMIMPSEFVASAERCGVYLSDGFRRHTAIAMLEG
jgi:phosphopantetheinyl transferase (holo-ACP synthase)